MFSGRSKQAGQFCLTGGWKIVTGTKLLGKVQVDGNGQERTFQIQGTARARASDR